MSAASSFDYVAATAVSGATPIVVAVGIDLATLDLLADWLESAVPTFGRRHVRTLAAADMVGVVESTGAVDRGLVYVVKDAGNGDDAVVTQRWVEWDRKRDRLLEHLDYGRKASVVLMLTRKAVGIAAPVSRQLLAVSTVLTVADDPVGEADDPDVRSACRAALGDLETRYGQSTAELLSRLLAGDDVRVPAHDLARWQAAAQALR